MKSFGFRGGLVLSVLVLAAPASFSSGVFEKNGPRSLNFDQVLQKVVIETDIHEIHLSGGVGRGAQGRVVGEESDTVDTQIVGDTLRIVVKSHRGLFNWSTQHPRVELRVPAGLIVEVTTVSGAIRVDVPTFQLSAVSLSGNIHAQQGGGLVFAKTTSGVVNLVGFSGPIKASSTSGTLQVQASQGLMDLSNVSGTIRGEALEPQDKSRFATVSGEIALDLGVQTAFTVTGKTTSGNISFWDQDGGKKLTMGSGPLHLELSSVSGNLTTR